MIEFDMALVKMTSDIVSIRGRLGGVYFKTGRDGQHVQAMPRSVKYTRSPAQQGKWGEGSPFSSSGIDGYSGAAALWLAALCAFFASLWAIYAISHFFYKVGKEPKKITGFNWFIHYALAFPETERPPFWKPPHAPGDLPDYIVSYKGMWMYEHAPVEQPYYSPGEYYWEGMEWNGRPTYHTDDLQWFLWWRGDVWVLSWGVDYEDPPTTFYSEGVSRRGYYRNPEQKTWARVYWGYKR